MIPGFFVAQAAPQDSLLCRDGNEDKFLTEILNGENAKFITKLLFCDRDRVQLLFFGVFQTRAQAVGFIFINQYVGYNFLIFIEHLVKKNEIQVLSTSVLRQVLLLKSASKVRTLVR